MTRSTLINRRQACSTAGLGLFGASLAARARAAESSAVPSAYQLDVRAFGATGGGQVDDTTAFQAALDKACQAGGGRVFVPAGNYLVATHLVVPHNVTLEGTFTAPPTTPWHRDTPDGKPQLLGSVLLAVEGADKPEGPPFIQLGSNATLKGITVFYPEQRETISPVTYPWTISSSLQGADNCSIIDVLLVNPYQAVDFGGRSTGRHLIRNLNAAPLFRGLLIDHCLDVGRMENVHLWPFWSATGPVNEFRLKEGKAFVIGRTDWQQITNCFCIGYETGFQFVRCGSTHPAYQGGGNAQIVGGGADLCNRAVHVVEVQGHSGVRFVNSQIYGDIIVEPTNNGPIQFTACGLFGSAFGAHGVALAGSAGGGKVSFTDCHIHCIDPRNTHRPLIHAKAGRLQVRGCEMIDGHAARDHVVLDPDVACAVVSDNTSRAAFSVINNAKGKTVIRDNIGEA
jgi:hypothetical protein